MIEEDSNRDFRLQLLRPISHYVSDHFSEDVFEDLAASVNLKKEDFFDNKKWVSNETMIKCYDQFAQLFNNNEERFLAANTYKIKESYGAIILLLWTLTPKMVYRQITKTLHLFSSVSRYEIVDEGKTWVRFRYSTNVKESRYFCLGRQAALKTHPAIWGLPPADIREHKCIGSGDECCEYTIRWYPKNNRLSAVLGTAVGAAIAAGLFITPLALPLLGNVALALLGGSVGYIYELNRVHKKSIQFAEESSAALEKIATHEKEAREHIQLLNQRQADWTKLVEQQVSERTHALEKVISSIDELQQEKVTTLRGVSHDLRSPLTIIRTSAEILQVETSDPEEKTIYRDQIEAVDYMDKMLREMMTVVSGEISSMKLRPETLDISALLERFRMQTKALVFGKDIRTSVFRTREAPEKITTDVIIFSRIVDNILTNAAKYTQRGSIVIEIDGRAEFLVIKVSDTGRGIAEDKISEIFYEGGSDESSRVANSYGMGLSVVVALLDEIGGKLEVISKENEGTTFWIYIPTTIKDNAEADGPLKLRQSKEEMMANVVKIRRLG